MKTQELKTIRGMKHKAAYLVVTLSLFSTALAVQLSVPNIEDAQDKVFSGFTELERLNAYVVGSDGKVLGTIAKGFDSNALGNEFGKGSKFDSDGLFNQFSDYGSKFSSKSAFCDTASNPPEILVKSGNTTYSVGLLTTNKLATTKGQHINPYLLKAWLGME